MGSGVGNVLAILYVCLSSEAPRVIAIDEPNAFLHPRALRELLAILASEGKQHQYFLTAHSADVITAVHAATVTTLSLNGSSSVCRQTAGDQLEAVREELSEIGVRITDLHSKDEIVWVEGPTEELVMPELIKLALPSRAAGIGVLRLEHTGSLVSKRAKISEALAIYRRLSISSSLVPPMICIVLDGDMRGKLRLDEAGIANRELIRFLDRATLEDYLVVPEAIKAVLGGLGVEISVRAIELDMEQARNGQPRGRKGKVDGPYILNRIFTNVSNSTQFFQKTRDVPSLVTWLRENNEGALEPLVAAIRKVLMQQT